jgi:hypothetical protein
MRRIAKVFLRSEKCLACDLQPGDLFVMDQPRSDLLDSEDVVVSLLLRTNLSIDELEDKETIVYKLTVLVTPPERVTPAAIDPHIPPGFKEV